MAILPIRRLNQAIYLLTTGAHEAAFRNTKTIAECLADELINEQNVHPTGILLQFYFWNMLFLMY